MLNFFIITLVFEENANFFAENCDHNIDPWNQLLALNSPFHRIVF
jgi:hypothetical protein